MTPEIPAGRWIESNVPPRLDALGWSRWHRRVILALGITWILDGLEASLISNLGPTLERADALALTGTQVGYANTAYLIGEVCGALVFGHLTDRLGRKKLFLVTLALYLSATALSGLANSFVMFAILRCFAGAGIGGEYSAINSAIDELVPARIRGQIDLAINGSYWIGVALGGGVTVAFLHALPISFAWRAAFGLGAVLGLVILLVRRDVPESPRWLLMHGHVSEAHRTVEMIEAEVRATGVKIGEQLAAVRIRVSGVVSLRHLAHVLLRVHPRRTVLGLALLLSQAFLYNSIFFSYGMILTKFHGVADDNVGFYMLPFAIGNFAGPVVLGRYFDRLGRRVMIPATYLLSGVLLVATGALFWAGLLDATTQTIAWSVVFFVASAAASSAYLTVSELFPVEIRGMAIAVFFAFATLVGAAAPTLFGKIVDSGSRATLFAGYALAAGLMIGAAVIARWLGVAAEGKSLEALAATGNDEQSGAGE
jgi:MFS family permease